VKRTALALALSLCVGCHSYLVPFDDRALPARAPVETASGQRLAVAWDGELLARPARGDIGAALGVALHDDDEGVLVSNRLEPDSRLEAGDRILWVAPRLPENGAAIRRSHGESLQLEVGPGLSFSEVLAQDPANPVSYDSWEPSAQQRVVPAEREEPPAPGVLRGLPAAHEVRSSEDLSDYLCGVGWLSLDLLVRRGEEELVVRAPLSLRQQWVPTRPLRPDRSRWRGVELVDVRDLPPPLRPRGSEPGDVLVTRVARGAPLGVAGLRPLDVLGEEAAGLLLDRNLRLRDALERGDELVLTVRGADGNPKLIEFSPRREPTNLWFPFLYSHQSDGSRFHVGVGPLDVLFHASSSQVYLPTQDRYLKSSRWSLLTLIQGGARRTEQGTEDWGGINFLVDDSRLNYFLEWFDTPRVVHTERGLLGY